MEDIFPDHKAVKEPRFSLNENRGSYAKLGKEEEKVWKNTCSNLILPSFFKLLTVYLRLTQWVMAANLGDVYIALYIKNRLALMLLLTGS